MADQVAGIEAARALLAAVDGEAAGAFAGATRLLIEITQASERGSDLAAVVAPPIVRFIASGEEKHAATGLVYYVRDTADGLIKIGTTEHRDKLKERLYRIGVNESRGRPILLAVEPGYRRLELSRHAQFCRQRVYLDSEWFRPDPCLVVHVEILANGLSSTQWWHGQEWAHLLSHYPWFTDEMLSDVQLRQKARGAGYWRSS